VTPETRTSYIWILNPPQIGSDMFVFSAIITMLHTLYSGGLEPGNVPAIETGSDLDTRELELPDPPPVGSFRLPNPVFRPFEVTLMYPPANIFHPEGDKIITGLNIGLGASIVGGVWGLDVGLWSFTSGSMYGVQIVGGAQSTVSAGVSVAALTFNEYCYGLCVSLGANGSYHVGVLVSAAGNWYNYGRGVEISLYNLSHGYAGLQASALFNAGRWDDGIAGVQLSFLNVGGSVRGAQVGAINIAKDLRGVQIGAINVAARNKLPFMVGLLAGGGAKHK
jgi:hypothetical protein